MKQKPVGRRSSSEQTIRDIKRKTRKQYSAEEKIRIVLDGLRGEDSIAELCRREGIAQSLYYSWPKEFLEAGKKRLAHLRVILFFCPIRASSWNQSSMSLLWAFWVATSASLAGKYF